MSKKTLKINDRVKRTNHLGCFGTVKDVREETGAKASDKDKENALLINIAWDNGTLSYVSSEALDLVDS